MLYVSNVGEMIYTWTRLGHSNVTVTDSESGNSFTIVMEKRSNKVRFLYGDGLFCMKEVMGYFNDKVLRPVDMRLVRLLGYVSEVVEVGSGDAIPVSNRKVDVFSSGALYLLSGKYTYDLLDVLLYASHDGRFTQLVMENKLVLGFKDRYFSVKFCGDYEAYVMKLVVMYQREVTPTPRGL